MKVFVTDDHKVIIDGFSVLLKACGFQLVGSSTNGRGLINWLENKDNYADVIILDISMPGMSGIDVLKELNRKHIKANILIVSGLYDTNIIKEAILLGVKGFVLKNEISQCIEEALFKIANGKQYFSEMVLDEVILRQLNEPKKIDFEDLLSNRESEALKLLMNDLSTKEICNTMNIKSSTFRKLLQRAREKTGTKNTIQLALLALKHQFLKI